MVKEISLHKVGTVNSDWNLFKELGNCEVLRSDTLLHEVYFVGSGCHLMRALANVKGFDGLLREAEALKGIEAVVRLAHIVDDNN